jgi:Na+/H+ antiporter NhaC
MLMTVWLMLVAAAFGAVVGYMGMLQPIIAPVINWAKSPTSVNLIRGGADASYQDRCDWIF